jgi:hypothetical protein
LKIEPDRANPHSKDIVRERAAIAGITYDPDRVI